MKELFDAFPTEQMILAAEPEDLAWPILAYLKRTATMSSGQHLSRHNTCNLVREQYRMSDAVQAAFMEAWNWLEVRGLIVARPGDPSGTTSMLSRRALALKDATEFGEFKALRQSGYDLLHPAIRDVVWPLYVRKDFDTAVGRAFKEVELAMRAKGEFPTSDFSERLIKKFFARFKLPGDHTKSDKNLPSEAYLFIGTYDLYRNPAVHQVPQITDPTFAMEVLLMASHMLRIVESAIERQSAES